MRISGGNNIRLEKADEKGMLNANVLLNYLPKAIKAICEINLSSGFGSGFFCKIPYTENNNLLLPVLITNNHVLPRDLINSKNEIKIIINGETKTIFLKQRKIWTDEKMDYTCIEIKEKEDNINSFYYLDDNVLETNCFNEFYLNKKVIIFGINKEDKQVGFSNGLIKDYKDCFFAYNCNTYPGCSGGCIVNQANNCVIGIHRGEIETTNKTFINEGIFISNVINNIKESKENLFIKEDTLDLDPKPPLTIQDIQPLPTKTKKFDLTFNKIKDIQKPLLLPTDDLPLTTIQDIQPLPTKTDF